MGPCCQTLERAAAGALSAVGLPRDKACSHKSVHAIYGPVVGSANTWDLPGVLHPVAGAATPWGRERHQVHGTKNLKCTLCAEKATLTCLCGHSSDPLDGEQSRLLKIWGYEG